MAELNEYESILVKKQRKSKYEGYFSLAMTCAI